MSEDENDEDEDEDEDEEIKDANLIGNRTRYNCFDNDTCWFISTDAKAKAGAVVG